MSEDGCIVAMDMASNGADMSIIALTVDGKLYEVDGMTISTDETLAWVGTFTRATNVGDIVESDAIEQADNRIRSMRGVGT